MSESALENAGSAEMRFIFLTKFPFPIQSADDRMSCARFVLGNESKENINSTHLTMTENNQTNPKIIYGKKRCGNPICQNEIPYTSYVAYMAALKYRPHSLCNKCKGAKAAKVRIERAKQTVREFRLSENSGSNVPGKVFQG